MSFGVNKTINATWSSTFIAYSRLASDKLSFTRDNFQLGLLSLFTKTKRDNLKFRYGVYVNTEEFGLVVVPIFGLYYLSNNTKFEANLNMPIIADINIKYTIKFGWGFDLMVLELLTI